MATLCRCFCVFCLVMITVSIAYASGDNRPTIYLFADCDYSDGWYHATESQNITLTAMLVGDDIGNKEVTFRENGNEIDTAMTNWLGVATLQYETLSMYDIVQLTAECPGFGYDYFWLDVIGRVEGLIIDIGIDEVPPSGNLGDILVFPIGDGDLSGISITLKYLDSYGNEVQGMTSMAAVQEVTEGGYNYYCAIFQNQTAPSAAGEYTIEASYSYFTDTAPLFVGIVSTQMDIPPTAGWYLSTYRPVLARNKEKQLSYEYTITRQAANVSDYTHYWYVTQEKAGKINIIAGRNSKKVTVVPTAISKIEDDITLNCKITRKADGRIYVYSMKLTVVYPHKGNSFVVDKGFKEFRPKRRSGEGEVDDPLQGDGTFGFYNRLDFVPQDQFNKNIQSPVWWEEHWKYLVNKSNIGNGWTTLLRDGTQGNWGTTDLWGWWKKAPGTYKNSYTYPWGNEVIATYNYIAGLYEQNWESKHIILTQGIQCVTFAGYDAVEAYKAPMFTIKGTITDTASVAVTLNATNQPPQVGAGPDIAIGLAGRAVINADVNDDGMPVEIFDVSIKWEKIAGPGTVTFHKDVQY